MIRVLWNVPNMTAWIGGLNYFINLYNGLLNLPERQVEPVILGSADQFPSPLCHCQGLPLPHSQAHRRFSPQWFMYKLRERILQKVSPGQTEESLARYLADNGIQLFSHGCSLGKYSPVPSLCWIPDFQHRHLPHFFTEDEVIERDKRQKYIAETAQGILLSSEDARADFNRFYPGYEYKTHVLHFVASVDAGEIPFATEVLTKYEIKEPFFHVPNQLWQHKNHSVILDALTILKSQGECPLIISTGHTSDYRNPHYFKDLQAKVENAGLTERFRFLGLINYTEVQVIMRESICLINPSLFEGWSTTVEEAKSLGKRLLLSNINVHREQAPERGIYFSSHDAETLAARIREVLDNYDPEVEIRTRLKAAADLPKRLQQVGKSYEDIVKAVLHLH